MSSRARLARLLDCLSDVELRRAVRDCELGAYRMRPDCIGRLLEAVMGGSHSLDEVIAGASDRALRKMVDELEMGDLDAELSEDSTIAEAMIADAWRALGEDDVGALTYRVDAMDGGDEEEGDPDDEGIDDDEHDAGVWSGELPDDVFTFDPMKAARRRHPHQEDVFGALRQVVGGGRFRVTVATGGGKTRIANDWLWSHVLPSRKRVLWVTKDWALLRQAASDACQRFEGARGKIGYVGQRGRQYFGGLSESAGAGVVYTTIHTWHARKDAEFQDERFDVVVIDELHWGEGKGAYAGLLKKYAKSTVLGLTATPRAGTSFRLVAREYDFSTLVRRDVLAQPRVHAPVQTGTSWTPGRSTSHGDFDRASLRTLARDRKRNAVILKTYEKEREKFGKTLVFACDIEHAQELGRTFNAARIPVGVVHSNMPYAVQQRIVDQFVQNETVVLVNVAMMTHGVDIPDIETVFLARPTTSKTLFAQMVGRGARKCEGKTQFHLVDFRDNLRQHGDALISSNQVFGTLDAPVSARRPYQRSPRVARHDFVESRFLLVPEVAGYESVWGLDVQPRQTFGVEFELTRPDFESGGDKPRDWARVAEALLESLPAERAKAPLAEYHSSGKDNTVWNVEWDSSCGWEVTSRVLSGSEGFFEVHDVCSALEERAKEVGLNVTPKTGTHVHLAWKAGVRQLQRLMQLVAHYEPSLYTLVAPSRAGNRYCQPIRSVLPKLTKMGSLASWKSYFSDHDNRYLSVNPSNLFGEYGTVEVRLHSGTLEGPKILAWLSLWMRILDAAAGKVAIPDSAGPLRELPLKVGPEGDIAVLARKVMAQPTLIERLIARRQIVMERWLANRKYKSDAEKLVRAWG